MIFVQDSTIYESKLHIKSKIIQTNRKEITHDGAHAISRGFNRINQYNIRDKDDIIRSKKNLTW